MTGSVAHPNPQQSPSDPATPELPADGQWFVLHTRSRQEKRVADDLAAMGVGYFLPLLWLTRSYGRRKMRIAVPMFPGYLFLRGSLDDTYRIDRTGRVAGILPVQQQQQLDWELRNIHLALSRRVPLDPYPHLVEGVRVEVATGPFAGLQGVVERRLGTHRLVLQVRTLGRGVSVEIDNAALTPLQ